MSQVKEMHKKAKQTSYEDIMHLELKDVRKVLYVARRSKDKIVFYFDFEAPLNSTDVYFKYDKLVAFFAKFDTLFGSHSWGQKYGNPFIFLSH